MEPRTFADLAKQAQLEQLEREAYPRRHWTNSHEAYQESHTRLTAGVGQWKYDPEFLTVTHMTKDYGIDLKELTTPAKLLDNLLQVAKTTWLPDKALEELVALLMTISREVFRKGLQGVFCPS